MHKKFASDSREIISQKLVSTHSHECNLNLIALETSAFKLRCMNKCSGIIVMSEQKTLIFFSKTCLIFFNLWLVILSSVRFNILVVTAAQVSCTEGSRVV